MYRPSPSKLACILGLALAATGAAADTGLRDRLYASYGQDRAIWDGSDLFAGAPTPIMLRAPVRYAGRGGGSGTSPVELPPEGAAGPRQRLRALIASAEAGRAGYDAVQRGAWTLPGAAPTRMTVGEILDWIARTPGQPHAIGRYQFIPATLRTLLQRAGLGRETRFSPAVQDRLADLLLEDAGLSRFESGALGRRDFMNNLARIWAGLPNSSGRSHYHGVAGNRATISWAKFESSMRAIYR